MDSRNKYLLQIIAFGIYILLPQSFPLTGKYWEGKIIACLTSHRIKVDQMHKFTAFTRARYSQMIIAKFFSD